MIYGPASLVVLLIVVLLIAVAVYVLRVGRSGSRRASGETASGVCEGCRHENLADATYCARCGAELKQQDS